MSSSALRGFPLHWGVLTDELEGDPGELEGDPTERATAALADWFGVTVEGLEGPTAIGG